MRNRNQLAIKAYGLLPLERGAEEALERYLFLQQFARESRKFGPQRQANEQGAVQAALTNLARTGGYSDATRLEWTMEARVAQDVVPLAHSWCVAEYRISLLLEGADARLAVQRGERALKSVPKAVRQSDAYPEMKDAVTQLRRQASRFRGAFEELMATGESLSRQDLEALAGLPVARALLSQLILRTQEDVFGLFNPEGIALLTLDGTACPTTDQVYIAHPYHLFGAGQLAGWQQAIVHQRIVQPFKQAFRELYLLTPAELEFSTFSNRFAGHILDPRVVTRLFQARGWQVQAEGGALPMKLLPKFGLTAVFEFPDAGHYLAETDVITSDRIYFLPHPVPQYRWELPEAGRLAVADVPPLAFSEVMRDADLVVSVAQRDGEARLSAEAYQRRGEVVEALLDDLALSGVTIEGHFAHVQGKLARYRVHLGTAAIHIEPGSYLCVVPARWGRRHQKLFLPFADADDPKLGEVISKILLLLNDNKIKDKSILSQIRARA